MNPFAFPSIIKILWMKIKFMEITILPTQLTIREEKMRKAGILHSYATRASPFVEHIGDMAFMKTA